MILSSSPWPDPDTVHSIRSRATALSRQFSYGSVVSHLDTPAETTHLQVHKPTTESHQRQKSNPFSILYDPEALPQQSSSPSKSPAYLEIENDILRGSSPNRAYSTSQNAKPVVTVIDDSELRRGQSIVSRSASMRRRNVIRKRNKMIRRDDLLERIVVDDEQSTHPSTTQKEKQRQRARSPKLSFLFPVRRRTSFKYYPIKASPKFSNEQDFERFYQACNGSEAVRELLPPYMAAYEFRNLISLIPTINIYPQFIKSPPSQAAPIVQKKDAPQNTDTEIRLTPSQSRTLAPPKVRSPSRFRSTDEGRRELIYQSYKRASFAGKHLSPLRLKDITTLDTTGLSYKDRELLDTRLLFEVLLRRTIAAKIDFRLKQQGYSGKSKREKKPRDKPSQNFSSSTSSGPSDGPSKHLKRRRRPRDLDLDSGSKNVGVAAGSKISPQSDPLPSPQISFNAYMFDPISYNSPTSRNGWTQRYIPPSEHSPNRRALLQNSPSRLKRSPSQTFIHNFDNVDLVSKRNPPPEIVSNIALYSMKPINRSEETFTSSEEEMLNTSMQTKASTSAGSKTASRGSTGSKTASRESGSSHTYGGKRASASTANTSVIRSLESLSDSVYDYLRSEGVMPSHN